MMSEEKGLRFLAMGEVQLGDAAFAKVSPRSERESAYLSSLRKGERVAIAFCTTAVFLDIEDVTQRRAAAIEQFELKGRVDRGPFAPSMEMSAMGRSADEIAEMRTRRILLNETGVRVVGESTADIASSSLLELCVRGFQVPLPVIASPLPQLWQTFRHDGSSFIASAKPFAALWLRMSGAIDEIWKLDLSIESESAVRVEFEGRRPRQFQNVSPHVIQIQGTLNMEQPQAPRKAVRVLRFDSERPHFDPFRLGVVFRAEIEEGQIVCFISWEALCDHFGASDPNDSSLEAFRSHRTEIERIAAELLRLGRLDDERRLLIRSEDVQTFRDVTGGGEDRP